MVDVAKVISRGRVMFYTKDDKDKEFPTFYFSVVNANESDAQLKDGIEHVIGISKDYGFLIQENNCWSEGPGWSTLKGISPQEFYDVFYSLWQEKEHD